MSAARIFLAVLIGGLVAATLTASSIAAVEAAQARIEAHQAHVDVCDLFLYTRLPRPADCKEVR